MQILSFDVLDSTQKYLIDALKRQKLQAPICIVTKRQLAGVGSRENSWVSNEDLLFSFALDEAHLPKDVAPQSMSIYFSFLLKEVLAQRGSNVWLKWPNDFYIDARKIGGTITNKIGDKVVCGIGINLTKYEAFGTLDIACPVVEILQEYFELLSTSVTWKEVFSKYKLEFYRSKVFKTHIASERVSLKEAILLEDGSLEIDKKRVYTIR